MSREHTLVHVKTRLLKRLCFTFSFLASVKKVHRTCTEPVHPFFILFKTFNTGTAELEPREGRGHSGSGVLSLPPIFEFKIHSRPCPKSQTWILFLLDLRPERGTGIPRGFEKFYFKNNNDFIIYNIFFNKKTKY